MSKYKIYIIVLLFSCAIIAALSCFWASRMESKHQEECWETDFKWFDVSVKDKNGIVRNIEVGIPLHDIDFTKSQKDSALSTPLSPLFNLHWLANQETIEDQRQFILQQFYKPAARFMPALEAACAAKDKKGRTIVPVLSPSDVIFCFAVLKKQNVCNVMKRSTNIAYSTAFFNSATVTEKCPDGKWRIIHSDDPILDDIETTFWYYDKNKTLLECWQAARGEPFPQNYQEYVNRKAKK